MEQTANMKGLTRLDDDESAKKVDPLFLCGIVAVAVVADLWSVAGLVWMMRDAMYFLISHSI